MSIENSKIRVALLLSPVSAFAFTTLYRKDDRAFKRSSYNSHDPFTLTTKGHAHASSFSFISFTPNFPLSIPSLSNCKASPTTTLVQIIYLAVTRSNPSSLFPPPPSFLPLLSPKYTRLQGMHDQFEGQRMHKRARATTTETDITATSSARGRSRTSEFFQFREKCKHPSFPASTGRAMNVQTRGNNAY